MKNNENLIEELNKLSKENESLKIKLKTLELTGIEREKTLEKTLNDNSELKEKNYNTTLEIQKLNTEVETWQRFTDEIAHSINTDVFIAVANLDKHKDLPRINKALYHTKQIRNLTNLIMWYIKRNEIKLSGEKKELNINEIIKQQLLEIKEGISTLRISSDEHEENILKMNINIEAEENKTVLISKEISEALLLVIKDLLRNAVKNTNEENPEVKIKISSDEKNVIVEIINNKAIPEDFSQWFNGETNKEPEQISKSFKVGLRIIKMWINLLKIKAQLLPDYSKNETVTKIILPGEINYETI